ncbi:cryptochrome/photolyase family protein [Dokdonella fugitiva]|uniref:cryptochrome/photolyase family protein n=1 Tax=Dokdonella fugitiva TaxID=328517 RepID=UPI0015FCA464|nr:deoxyribodipyrimidine photo-lyase [Dokdonella fugitiva]MBA8883287.1 deoxyribodipyrimidine photo-lyase [Dokdonella fugitiva]
MSIALAWFRRDLRLADNPALAAALAAHDHVVPVYVHAPHEEAPWPAGAASRCWLHRSLVALDRDLRARGSTLHVYAGDSLATLREVAAATGAHAVYWNRLYEPAARARDASVEQALRADGLGVHGFNSALLCEPWAIATASGGPYRVFTPYWRNLRARLEPRPPLPAPHRMPATAPATAPIDALDLLPRRRWDAGFDAAWRPGEASAEVALQRFLDEALGGYAVARDVPSVAGTSRLSPHLHFGEISPMRIAWEIEHARVDGKEAFLRELGWREFSHHLLFHFPASSERNLDPAFDAYPWARIEPRQLRRWQQGRTGMPIVDAGMRELWATGWMHNRVRMLVASFLTKNLRQHWLHGARWFWDTLVDADLANNTQGWQWTAGTGADAAPYFRIFNPVTQGERFDPDGAYIRRWVPELAAFDARTIHRPWTVPAALRRSGYPAPIIDLGASRAAALAGYESMRRAER